MNCEEEGDKAIDKSADLDNPIGGRRVAFLCGLHQRIYPDCGIVTK